MKEKLAILIGYQLPSCLQGNSSYGRVSSPYGMAAAASLLHVSPAMREQSRVVQPVQVACLGTGHEAAFRPSSLMPAYRRILCLQMSSQQELSLPIFHYQFARPWAIFPNKMIF